MFKTILVSICLIMAAASASFANGENDKCKAAAAPVVEITENQKPEKNTCTYVIEYDKVKISKTWTCECKMIVACFTAKNNAEHAAGWQ